MMGRRRPDDADNAEVDRGSGEFLLVESNQEITPNKLKDIIRSLRPAEIAKRLAAGNPRFTPEESRAKKIDLVEDYRKWLQFAAEMQQASTIVVCGHHDGLGDSIHHLRYSLAFAKQYPDKTIVHLTRNPELFSEQSLPRNLVLRQTNPKEQVVGPNDATSPDTVLFNPSLFQPILRSRFGGPNSQFVFAETQRGQEGVDIFSSWYYTGAPTPNEDINRRMRRWRSKSKENLYYTDSAHQIVDQATKLRFLLGVEKFQVKVPMREPQPVKRPADIVIISDAAEGAGAKLPQPEQVAEYIVSVFQQHPDIRISLVRGINNPKFVEQIIQNIHRALEKSSPNRKIDFNLSQKIIDSLRANVFSGSLEQLYDHGMAAKLIVTVDTGPGHIFNEAARAYRDQQAVPEIISLLGHQPYNALYYRLDLATTFIASGQVKNLPMAQVTAKTQELLQ